VGTSTASPKHPHDVTVTFGVANLKRVFRAYNESCLHQPRCGCCTPKFPFPSPIMLWMKRTQDNKNEKEKQRGLILLGMITTFPLLKNHKKMKK
ncbi:unnamed protein product, partial [Sphenostylis stenocarpa]